MGINIPEVERQEASKALNCDRQCPLWVISGHRGRSRRCPLLPPKANIDAYGWNVRFVPIADIAGRRTLMETTTIPAQKPHPFTRGDFECNAIVEAF